MNATNGPVISIKNLCKTFGKIEALKPLYMDFPPGEIVGLIGHNGAGKSTLFKLMMGIHAPTTGSVEMLGVNNQSKQFRQVKARVGYLPEHLQFYENLTGIETLGFFAELKNVPRHHLAPLLDDVGLSEHGQRPVREYSKGMRQRLGFAQALLGAPRLLFLDEPTNGLDPDGISHFYTLIDNLKRSGTSIILSSHILSEIEQRVDKLAVLKDGELVAFDTMQGLRRQLQLPLKLSVNLKETASAEGFAKRMRSLSSGDIKIDTHHVLMEIESNKKTVALAEILNHQQDVSDFYWQEPRLEDLYRSLRHAH